MGRGTIERRIDGGGASRRGREAPPPLSCAERSPSPRATLAGGTLSRFLQRALRLRDDAAERLGLVHRDVGEHFPVEIDPGELQRVDELAVGHAFGADRRVDPLDPQGAEAPLLHLAVAIGVLPGLLDRLAGDADRVLAAAVIALRLIEDPLVLGSGGHTAFDACHLCGLPTSGRTGPRPSRAPYRRRREFLCRGSGGYTWRCG